MLWLTRRSNQYSFIWRNDITTDKRNLDLHGSLKYSKDKFPECPAGTIFDGSCTSWSWWLIWASWTNSTISALKHKDTSSLFNKKHSQFLTILGVSQEFLQDDPSEWKCDTQLSEYKRSQRLIQSLRVVNNLAESYVALTHEFNSSLKGDEE